MSTPQHTLPPDRQRRVEQLLNTAAEYEPTPPMPAGLEARALTRRPPRRAVFSRSWQPLLVSGFALTLGALYVVFFVGHSFREGHVRPMRPIPAAVSARSRVRGMKTARSQAVRFLYPEQPAVANRATSGRKRLHEDPTTVRIGIRLAMKQGKYADYSAKPASPTHAPLHGKGFLAISAQRHNVPPGYAEGAKPAPVWRTEIVETETVQFVAPAVIARLNRAPLTADVTPALLVFPVRKTDVFCSIHARAVKDDALPTQNTSPGETDENH